MWSIRVLSGSQSGQVYDLKLGKNIFGRGGLSDLKIQSLGISKEHCEIHVYKDKMMIVDLKSSNGTFVNGVKIQNSIIRIGDKISLFDVILDIIPTPDIRPKAQSFSSSGGKAVPTMKNPPVVTRPPQPLTAASDLNYPTGYPQQGNAALQMSYQPHARPSHPAGSTQNTYGTTDVAPVLFSQKIENYIENVVMPVIYKLGIIFTFKQILMSFVIIFIFAVTLLSTVPLTNIIKESNLNEATKRAKSVARAMANYNSQALLSGQLASPGATGGRGRNRRRRREGGRGPDDSVKPPQS